MLLKSIKNIAVASLIGVAGICSTAANAVSFSGALSLGTVTNTNDINHTALFFTPSGTNVNNVYEFKIAPGVPAASLITVDLQGAPLYNFNNLMATLYEPSNMPTQKSGDLMQFNIASPVASTSYYLQVTGVTSGTNGGFYALNISAVPLPAAAWLFISGILAMGGWSVMKRKREEKSSIDSGMVAI